MFDIGIQVFTFLMFTFFVGFLLCTFSVVFLCVTAKDAGSWRDDLDGDDWIRTTNGGDEWDNLDDDWDSDGWDWDSDT